jgi:O-antigen ligase
VNKYLGVVIGAAIIFIIVIVLLYVFLGRTNSVNAQTALVGTVIVSIVVLVMFTIVAVGTIIVMKGSVKEIYKSITLIPEPNSK